MESNSLKILSEILRMVGEVMVAYTAIRVHYRVRKEHRIDDRVFSIMKREQWVGISGILILVLGFCLEIYLLA